MVMKDFNEYSIISINSFSRKNGFAMTMKAITKIAKGDEIIHAYTEPLDPVMTRKSILSLGKFFQVLLE